MRTRIEWGCVQMSASVIMRVPARATHACVRAHAHTHTHFLSLSLAHTHTHTFSLSLSLSHTHTHTQTHAHSRLQTKHDARTQFTRITHHTLLTAVKKDVVSRCWWWELEGTVVVPTQRQVSPLRGQSHCKDCHRNSKH